MEFEKQKPVGGTRSREAFKRAGKSADFPGSKAMRRIKPLQRKKKPKLASDFITEMLRETSVLDLVQKKMQKKLLN